MCGENCADGLGQGHMDSGCRIEGRGNSQRPLLPVHCLNLCHMGGNVQTTADVPLLMGVTPYPLCG
ncbi:hypothetical protein Pjdr2_0027 [Paenibacillus sp. JDR-2]|nr:hypothetical protein Pjdr2_0027 [Paenibacillus sp. JDR-2]